MLKLKLNSLPREIFEVNVNDKASVKCNGADLNRADIVAMGKLITCERLGSRLTTRPDTEKYVSRLNGVDYGVTAEKYKENLVMYCATLANAAVGREAPANFEECRKNSMAYAKDEVFLRTLAAITVDVIQPLYAKVWDDVAGGLMEFRELRIGDSGIVNIKSNDVFIFEDSAFGSGSSATYQYLYGKSLSLLPTAKQCNARAHFFQMIMVGDPGDYYLAIMNGMWNKIYAEAIDVITGAISNTAYIPAGLTAATYTSANLARIETLVAAANGVKRSDLVAIGEIGALQAILPVDGTGAAVTGLQYGLGEEWFKRGYLPNAFGVQLLEVEPVIVPGTQNSTLLTKGLGDNIIIAAKGGIGYAPIFVGMYEDSPFTLEFTPADGTADYDLLIKTTAMFDVKPVFASKVGVITNVSL